MTEFPDVTALVPRPDGRAPAIFARPTIGACSAARVLDHVYTRKPSCGSGTRCALRANFTRLPYAFSGSGLAHQFLEHRAADGTLYLFVAFRDRSGLLGRTMPDVGNTRDAERIMPVVLASRLDLLDRSVRSVHADAIEHDILAWIAAYAAMPEFPICKDRSGDGLPACFSTVHTYLAAECDFLGDLLTAVSRHVASSLGIAYDDCPTIGLLGRMVHPDGSLTPPALGFPPSSRRRLSTSEAEPIRARSAGILGRILGDPAFPVPPARQVSQSWTSGRLEPHFIARSHDHCDRISAHGHLALLKTIAHHL